MKAKRSLVLVAAATFVASLLVVPGAGAGSPQKGGDEIRTPGMKKAREEFYNQHHQHGPMEGHLPAITQNAALVGKQRLTNRENKISDVAVLGDYAYVGEWVGGLVTPNCRGGTHVVDISDPTDPTKVAFLPSHPGTYVTEGVQALHVENPGSFTGDLLVISNEACAKHGIGGLTLWDVTDPRNAKLLSQGGGDFTNGDVDSTDRDPIAHQAHSAMAWQDGSNVYAIAIDNEEELDVDFFDITDPTNPVLLSETGLVEWPSVVVNAYGDFPTSHDFDVRFLNGHWYAMISYWDAGWVLLNVDDPANPTLVGDSNYPACDAFAGQGDVPADACPPEGNAHQGEWNEDGSLFIGTDEDFSPYRGTPLTVTAQTTAQGGVEGQPAVGTQYEAGEFGWTVPISTLEDGILNGPVVFGGYGCNEDASLIPPASVLDPYIDPNAASPEERILVVQRGPVGDPGVTFEACFFSIKVENAQNAGYDAVVVANHHEGAVGGEQPDAFFCGSMGHEFTVTAVGVCTGHRAMHELFGTTPSYAFDYAGEDAPLPGDVGPKVQMTSFFDGWGYSWLLDANSLAHLDATAIPQQIQEEFATGFGDQTVHEVATGRGPDADLGYYSWYSGGFRVIRFGPSGIQELGAFIDEGGNDFWGVQLTDKFVDGQRVVALSDMDYGLYLLRYDP